MPTTNSGEKISWKEAGKRFKKGLDEITPLQKLRNEIRGTFITLLGFILSLIAVIWKREAIGLLAYGLILIFLGSIITIGLKYISLKQQLKFFNNIESEINVNDLFSEPIKEVRMKKKEGKDEP